MPAARSIRIRQSSVLSLRPPRWILMEVADALAESQCRGRAPSGCTIASERGLRDRAASRELLDRALELYHQHADKEWTLTDCTSFTIMRDRGVSEALTGDKQFRAGRIRRFAQVNANAVSVFESRSIRGEAFRTRGLIVSRPRATHRRR